MVLGISAQGAETVDTHGGQVYGSGDKFHGHAVLGKDCCRGE
jgi:hypothetical protein